MAIFSFLFGCKGYKVENGKVYYGNWNEGNGAYKTPLLEADAATFQKLAHSAYGKDKDHAFYEGRIIKDADAASFLSIDDYYGKDDKRAFYSHTIIEKAHGKTFEVIKGNYSRDDQDIYYMHSPMSACDPVSFKILRVHFDDWTKDKCAYYYQRKKVPLKDYDSFIPMRFGFGKDKFNVYFQDKVVPELDTISFEMCDDRNLGQDRNGRHDGTSRLLGSCK